MNVILRWYLKKLSRMGLIFATAGVRFLKKRPPSLGVRVLTYHKFGKKALEPFCLPTRQFEEQLKMVQSSIRVLSYEDLIFYIHGNLKCDENSILITIDDGDVSVYREAIPLLDKYKIPAILFISPGKIESELKTSSERNMNWKEIQNVADKGFTIGSHGWSHQSMTSLSLYDAFEEAHRSKKIMEDILNCTIDAFSYPYGTQNDHDHSTRFVLKSTGYKCAFTAQHGVCLPFQNSFTIPRIQIESGENKELYRYIINGALDSWWIVQKLLFNIRKNKQTENIT